MKEISVTNREANQREKEEDIKLLKQRVGDMTANITDLEDQNNHLKLQLLCNNSMNTASTT